MKSRGCKIYYSIAFICYLEVSWSEAPACGIVLALDLILCLVSVGLGPKWDGWGCLCCAGRSLDLSSPLWLHLHLCWARGIRLPPPRNRKSLILPPLNPSFALPELCYAELE